MDITKRLSVEPDGEGGYEIQLREIGDSNDIAAWHFITRAEADALIAALQPPQPANPKGA